MILDFLVFGNNIKKGVKVRGISFPEDAAREALLHVERETSRPCSTVVLVPGNRPLEELAQLTMDDLLRPGMVLQVFQFDE